MESIKENKVNKKKLSNIYHNSIIVRRLNIPFINIDENIKDLFKNLLAKGIEGTCIIEGYVKKDSINIISYSSGELSADTIVFNVIFECLICNPVEGMQINCKVKDITKAGIRAIIDEETNPLIIFVARDHHYMSSLFSKLNNNDNILVKVIGQRFELNDKYISVIAELVEKKEIIVNAPSKISKKKPKLVLE